MSGGTLIDASLVEADGRRPRQGEPVEDRSDRDASWNALPEQPLFGYKAHVAVDQGSGLVRQAILTPANVSDKTPFLALVQGDEQAGYADQAATTAGGTRRGWPGVASKTASWHAATGGGRSMPPAAPATGRSRRCGRRSSPPSRSSSAGTAIAGSAIARWSRNGLQLQLLAHRHEPAPHPGAGRLRAGSAPGGRRPCGPRRQPGATAWSTAIAPSSPFLVPKGTNSAFTQSSRPLLVYSPIIGYTAGLGSMSPIFAARRERVLRRKPQP